MPDGRISQIANRWRKPHNEHYSPDFSWALIIRNSREKIRFYRINASNIPKRRETMSTKQSKRMDCAYVSCPLKKISRPKMEMRIRPVIRCCADRRVFKRKPEADEKMHRDVSIRAFQSRILDLAIQSRRVHSSDSARLYEAAFGFFVAKSHLNFVRKFFIDFQSTRHSGAFFQKQNSWSRTHAVGDQYLQNGIFYQDRRYRQNAGCDQCI